MTPIDFEKIHKMFDGLMFDLCAECGGICEKNTLCILLPGEAEYVAHKFGGGSSSVKNFIDRYLTTITYQGHKVYILIGDCQFLCKTEHTCGLEKFNAKFLTCLVYPAVLGYPADMKRIFIDDVDCPLAHRVSNEFRQKAFTVLEFVLEQLPDWWLELNMKHHWPIYHYDKLKELSRKKVITIEELMECEINR